MCKLTGDLGAINTSEGLGHSGLVVAAGEAGDHLGDLGRVELVVADDLVIGVVGAEDAVLVEGDVAVRVLDHLLGRGGSDNITGGLKCRLR